MHAFYDAIGGLPGYQQRCLEMIAAGRAAAAASADGGASSSADPGNGRAAPRLGQHEGPGGREQGDLRGDPAQGDAGVRFHLPRGPDLAGPDGRALAAAAAAAGLEALPRMAEIYPIGGAHLESWEATQIAQLEDARVQGLLFYMTVSRPLGCSYREVM